MIFIQSKREKGKTFERFNPYNPIMLLFAIPLTLVGSIVILCEYGKFENLWTLYKSWFQYDDVTFM